ncbi:MAG: hypothetical protein BWY15_01178 [Firmicutes bacterium ADurb.Bin193]|nr:MAG: hypothetical protein BWY15_01178 [Firmicutes bacterium ADurb.Bin193]
MAVLAALITALGFLEIIPLDKKEYKREIVLFIFLAAIALSLGLFYLKDPFRTSIAGHILKLIGKEE